MIDLRNNYLFYTELNKIKYDSIYRYLKLKIEIIIYNCKFTPILVGYNNKKNNLVDICNKAK